MKTTTRAFSLPYKLALVCSLALAGSACGAADESPGDATAAATGGNAGGGMAGGGDTGGAATGSGAGTSTSPGASATTDSSGATGGSATGDFVSEQDMEFIADTPSQTDPSMAGGFVPSEKVDLLLVIDNSSSMADKQAIFKQAVPDLIDQMVNPPCVNNETNEFSEFPAGEIACPSGTRRIFDPVTDIHIGVLSSSLGPLGTQGDEIPYGCTDTPGENDKSWLLGRVRADLTADSYQNWGFLVWDPKGEAQPPGDSDLSTLIAKFNAQIDEVGESGCGFEAPLEAAYRFLSEPDPYLTLERVPCPGRPDDGNLCVEPQGVDQDLLDQRAAFLRPDSVVVVMFLTDENDCSLRAKGQGYMAMMTNTVLSNGTNACDANPNDACCLPCGVALPDGCDTDPATNGCGAGPEDVGEARPLRCFDQLRRFGVSFLRSTDVYVGGYIYSNVGDRAGNPVQNPLFTPSRGREKIFVVGVIGVPWQDTATEETVNEAASGRLDLIEASEVDWARYLPTGGNFPTDPFNIEGMGMREGTHPITGEAVGGPGTWNSINGHDRVLATNDLLDDDLQYSCIFPLPEPRNCEDADGYGSCDCVVETDAEGNVSNYYDGNPLCYDTETGEYGQTQYYAKAYPSPRMLKVLQGVSCPPDPNGGEVTCTDQSVVASICPRQVSNVNLQDFGYRPVIRALLLNVAKRIVR